VEKIMPMKLNIGLCRKVGESNYGSRGASINLELELDSSLVGDSAKLKERIHQLFGLVRTSLAEELNGGNGKPANHPDGANTTQSRSANANGNGTNGSRNPPKTPRPATQSQVKAIHAIARSRQVDIGQFLQSRFHVTRPDDLSIKDASLVIDELKNPDGQGA
jgi:hypothetical protein